MRLLVTGGNTMVPIDRVRQITNGFSGRTGAAIAKYAHEQGHDVTLMTSRPETLGNLIPQQPTERWRTIRYESFQDLLSAMQDHVQSHVPDAIIHSAAVSDYEVASIYTPAPGATVVEAGDSLTWKSADGASSHLVNAAAGKVKSNAPEVWLRLTPTPKIVDLLRREWGFAGVLVKFKLEVGVDEERLLEIAEASRQHSQADLMVANTLETAPYRAYIGPTPEGYRRMARRELPARLLEMVEHIAQSRSPAIIRE